MVFYLDDSQVCVTNRPIKFLLQGIDLGRTEIVIVGLNLNQCSELLDQDQNFTINCKESISQRVNYLGNTVSTSLTQ
jgi:hypothetical protein